MATKNEKEYRLISENFKKKLNENTSVSFYVGNDGKFRRLKDNPREYIDFFVIKVFAQNNHLKVAKEIYLALKDKGLENNFYSVEVSSRTK